MSDEFIDKLREYLENPPPGTEERVQEMTAITAISTEWIETAGGWMARKGRFLGVGATKDAAGMDVYRKIFLHFRTHHKPDSDI